MKFESNINGVVLTAGSKYQTETYEIAIQQLPVVQNLILWLLIDGRDQGRNEKLVAQSIWVSWF